jgi:hypothetical protein
MNRTLATVLVLLLISALAGGCGKSEEQKTMEQAAEQAQQAAESMKDMAQSMQDVNNQTPVPPVSFRALYDYLPKSVEGLPAGKPTGETTTMGENSWSHAEVEYEAEGKEQRAEVSISDFAHIGILYAPLVFFSQQNFRHEDENGYERAVKIGDAPSMEKWEIESKHGSVQMLVGGRFLVDVNTYAMGEGSARKVAEGIDAAKLAALKAD